MADAPEDDDTPAIDMVVTSTIAEFGRRAEVHLEGIIAIAIREGEFNYARFLNKVAGEVVRRRQT